MDRERRYSELLNKYLMQPATSAHFLLLRASRVRHQNSMPKLGPTHKSEKNAGESLICITCTFCFLVWFLDVVFFFFFCFYYFLSLLRPLNRDLNQERIEATCQDIIHMPSCNVLCWYFHFPLALFLCNGNSNSVSTELF